MSKIRLFGTSSGYVEIAPAAAASNNTLTAPSTVGEIIAKDAAGAIGVTSVHTTNITATGIATITTAKIGAGVTISESGIEASGIGITCANINGTQIGGRRNIVINGAMNIAQRNTTSTTSGYTTLDRWANSYAADASMTFTQHALTSSDSGPYEEGLRFSNHAVNGDTAAGATQSLNWQQPIEAQNIAKSGWNYTSPNSFVTLSFWAKSSVGQTFNMSVMTIDGTIYKYPFDVTLAANTWTKVIKTIPGNANLQINNDNGEGFRININVFTGTSYTASGVTNDTWSTWSSSARFKDSDATWFTTDGATFEYTGVQLEVGSQATPFEHLSFSEELLLCQRYYYKSTQYSYPIQNAIETGQQTDGDGFLGWVFYNNTSCRSINYDHPVEMRASPTVNFYSSARVSSPTDGKMALYTQSAWVNLSSNTANPNTRRLGIKGTSATNFSAGQVYLIGGGFECGAEL